MPHQLPKIGEPGQSFTRIANMIRFKNRGFFTPNLFFMAFRLKYGVFLNRFQIKAPPKYSKCPTQRPRQRPFSSGATPPATSKQAGAKGTK